MTPLRRLYGVQEAADALGVRASNLHHVRGLPDPLYQLRCGRLYDADAIDALAIERQSRPQYRAAQLAKGRAA